MEAPAYASKPMRWYRDSDATKLVVGVFFVLVIIALIAFLSLVEVPPDNKPTIMLLMGSLSTAAGFAINSMAGEPRAEKEELLKRIAEGDEERQKLLEDNIQLTARCDTLEKRLEELHNMLTSKAFPELTRKLGVSDK